MHMHMHMHMAHAHGTCTCMVQVAALARSSSPRRPGQRAPLPIKTHHGHVLVRRHAQIPSTWAWAGPALSSCASSGRTWRLGAARCSC